MDNRGAVAVALGLILSAVVFGMFFRAARTDTGSVRVVGSADKLFDTDIVKWDLELGRQSEGATAGKDFAALRQDLAAVSARLESFGIAPGDIEPAPPVSYPMYGQDGRITGYQTGQTLSVITGKIHDVEKLALNPEGLLSPGTVLRNSRLQYFYSDVERLKRELLADAAADARLRAESIASSSGLTVGPIREARAGVFQITEPYSTEVQSYGIYNTSSRKKQIRVTVHAAFELR